MGKRGNEHQITKDDYEADEDPATVEESSATSFQRANPDVLAQRRFVRSTKRPASSTGSGGVGGSSSGTGGAFANINLVPTNRNSISSQAGSGKPRFAMPSYPEYNSQKSVPTTTTGSNPFGGLNLTASNNIAKSGSQQEPKSESAILTEEFIEFIKNADLRKDYELPAIRYLTTMNKLLSSNGASATRASSSSVAPSTMGSTNGSQSGTDKSKSLFAPAPAPVAFSFGSTLQNPTSAPTASTPTFSFSSAGSSSVTGGAPAVGISSGFSFAPAPMAAVSTPGTNIKIALSPVPAPSLTVTKSSTSTTNNGGEDDDDALPPEEKTELASADDDWDSLLSVKVRAYNYRNENKPRKFASGPLKVQQHKESKKRRMVLRDGAGKVWINIGIFRGMEFTKTMPQPKPGTRAVGKIAFVGVNDEDRGGEAFALVCALDELHGFHKMLEESSS